MTWNYRIIEHDKKEHPCFAVHEVYYDEKGRIEAWTEDPIDIDGETEKDTIRTLRMMLKDVTNQTALKESEMKARLRKRRGSWEKDLVLDSKTGKPKSYTDVDELMKDLLKDGE